MSARDWFARRTLFVAIEGGEGAGKSSLISRMKKSPRFSSWDFTREPGGSEEAERIREFILSPESSSLSAEAMLHLFLAARVEHLEKHIRPKLEVGQPVICDRFDMSTWAYQVMGDAEGSYRFRQIFNASRASLLPNLYILLDVDPEKGLARRRGQGQVNHLDSRGIDYHRRVREGFLSFASEVSPEPKVVVVDANRSSDYVLEKVMETIYPL